MLSMLLDKIFLALCCIALLIRIFLQPSLSNIESLGQEHIAVLVNSLILFIITFLFILKKILLRENIFFPTALKILTLFCLIASFSIFYSIDAPSSILYTFDLWASFFFMLVLVNLLSSVRSIETIIGILITLMVITSINAAYEYLVVLPKVFAQYPQGIPGADRGVQELLSSHRPRTIFGWPNILSGFLVMTLPLLMAYWVYLRSRAVQILLGLSLIVAVYALFVTMTISSWIGLLSGAMVFLLVLKKPSFTSKEKIWSILILFLIAVIISFTVFKKMTMSGVNSTGARQQYFTSSCSLIKLHPFLGSGWRSYGVANAAYIKDLNGRSYFAHNSYLQIWTELGIIGLIVFLSFLWYLWKDALVLFQERHRKSRWLVCAIIAGIVGCMADNLFSYTMIKPQVALFWWVLCALLIALKENLEPSGNILKLPNTWKKVLLLLTLAGGIMTVRFTQAEYDFFTAVHDIHQGTQFEAAQLLCLDAKKLNPWDKKFDLARAYALYGSFIQNHDIHTLQSARDAALSTEGQVSLNFERDALLKTINDNLNHSGS